MNLFQSALNSCDFITKNRVAILLVRGIVGIVLMAYAFVLQTSTPIAGWGLLAVSILLLKGCPACWGMYLVNALRGSKKTHSASQIVEIEIKSLRSKQYVPKDMAEHLFPPEDVQRFRRRSET